MTAARQLSLAPVSQPPPLMIEKKSQQSVKKPGDRSCLNTSLAAKSSRLKAGYWKPESLHPTKDI